MLPIVLAALGVVASSAFTLEVVALAYFGALIGLPLTIALASSRAPEGIQTGQVRPSLRRLLTSLRANKPFGNYFGIFFAQGIANGMLYTVEFTFHDSYLQSATRSSAGVSKPAGVLRSGKRR
ncbi:MAG: hypothetical protein ACI87W_003062 [Halieaceae bacterium]|jgi:hypothetical protein